jgi:uncharacterized repeat protein (TIGR03803 family)
MKQLYNLVGACVSAAILTGCGGANSGFPSSTPMSVAPQSGAPGAMRQKIEIAAPKPASSYQLLYSFRGVSDGSYPVASLINVNGVLYGTTLHGGANYCPYVPKSCGTVFSVTTNGTETVLYNFRGGSDGAVPGGHLISVNGTLYGTTEVGGTNGYGTVFSVTKTGTEKVLYSFRGDSDGAYPTGSLIDVDGMLYGTSSGGGASGDGTVFSVTKTGTENVIYSFGGGSDGESPNDGLISVNGTLYGTTYVGPGSRCFGFGCGIVYSITTTGKEKVLHRFGRGSDGQNPEAGLINVNGKLYGTTTFGGSDYNGTVFSVTVSGKEKVLHSFRISDGSGPGASLIDVNGTLYGTTIEGGAKNEGAVFSVTKTGVEKVLYSFGGGSDGALLYDSLINVNGTLYGTTYSGGGHGCRHHAGCGTVFALTP